MSVKTALAPADSPPASVTRRLSAPGGRGPGRGTLPAILRAAGELLDESGFDGLSTTSVAHRAGISTATLYRHFPDKLAILKALVIHLQNERAEAIAAIYHALGCQADWREPAARAVRTAFRLRLAQAGGRSSRRALQVSPELWAWDQRQTEEIAANLARAIRRRKPALSAAQANRVALVTVTASTALLDLASLGSRRDKAILEEAILMRIAYLALYLD